jgi:hypothetical protein
MIIGLDNAIPEVKLIQYKGKKRCGGEAIVLPGIENFGKVCVGSVSVQKHLLRPMKYPLQQLNVGRWFVGPQFQNEIVDSRFRQKDVLSGSGY